MTLSKVYHQLALQIVYKSPNNFYRRSVVIVVLQILILALLALKLAGLLEVKKKRAVGAKQVRILGKPICVVKQIRLIGVKNYLWLKG